MIALEDPPVEELAGASEATTPEPAPQRSDVAPLGPRAHLFRAVLLTLAVVATMVVLHLLVLSGFQHAGAQQRKYDEFRSQLANGTAPTGPLDEGGRELPIGTPVAFMTIPSIGLREVVSEGTASATLADGPGHRRDSMLPGQFGTSVVYGRHSAFGGPFGNIDELVAGDAIEVTTGQGEFAYRVIGVRRAGDPLPPAVDGDSARLVLVTADGPPFVPSGVVRVDADLVGDGVVGTQRVRSASQLPSSEQLLHGDTRSLWLLALWLQAALLVSLGAVYVWQRCGRAFAWIVFGPAIVLVTVFAASELARLLPNLM